MEACVGAQHSTSTHKAHSPAGGGSGGPAVTADPTGGDFGWKTHGQDFWEFFKTCFACMHACMERSCMPATGADFHALSTTCPNTVLCLLCSASPDFSPSEEPSGVNSDHPWRPWRCLAQRSPCACARAAVCAERATTGGATSREPFIGSFQSAQAAQSSSQASTSSHDMKLPGPMPAATSSPSASKPDFGYSPTISSGVSGASLGLLQVVMQAQAQVGPAQPAPAAPPAVEGAPSAGAHMQAGPASMQQRSIV